MPVAAPAQIIFERIVLPSPRETQRQRGHGETDEGNQQNPEFHGRGGLALNRERLDEAEAREVQRGGGAKSRCALVAPALPAQFRAGAYQRPPHLPYVCEKRERRS